MGLPVHTACWVEAIREVLAANETLSSLLSPTLSLFFHILFQLAINSQLEPS